MFAKLKTSVKGLKQEASSSHASTSKDKLSSIEAKMETMIHMMTELQGEVEKIKEEQKPRKKGPKARDSETDTVDFSNEQPNAQ